MRVTPVPTPFPLPIKPEKLPRMAKVRVTFPRPRIADIAGEVRTELDSLRLPDLKRKRIAVTAGSRGIRNIASVLTAALAWLRERGAEPVVVAAMGSHGGATAEGQRSLLAHLGITEESVGAPIRSEMEVVELGRSPDGLTAFCDRVAASCDGILVVNRIKPHTGFAEPLGSGIMKMLAVGLGKAPGAAQIHRQGSAQMAAAIEAIASVMLATGKVLGGLAIMENAYDETAVIRALAPGELSRRERELFIEAKRLMPRLPVDVLDLLIVDEIGKNISGSGMDVNVIGRWRLPDVPEPPTPRITRIVALRLTPESEGNAQGVGLADVVTRRLVDEIDPVATYVNSIVSTFIERAFIPLTMSSDRDAILAALASLSLAEPARARVARIRNTLHLEDLWLSESLLKDVASRSGVDIEPARDLTFTVEGDLTDLA
ncbi:MAG TPA: lactate racemase domain-containing protein [bacterium]|nr:lactate racemase domain-containing protein [bacterium]